MDRDPQRTTQVRVNVHDGHGSAKTGSASTTSSYCCRCSNYSASAALATYRQLAAKELARATEGESGSSGQLPASASSDSFFTEDGPSSSPIAGGEAKESSKSFTSLYRMGRGQSDDDEHSLDSPTFLGARSAPSQRLAAAGGGGGARLGGSD